MRRFLPLLLVVSCGRLPAVVAPQGPQPSWSVYQHDLRHTGQGDAPGPSSQPAVLARLQICSTADPCLSPPSLNTENQAFAGTYATDDYEGIVDNYLYAFTPAGSVFFRFPLGSGPPYRVVGSAPAIGSDGSIYFLSYTTNGSSIRLHALAPDGRLRWQKEVCSNGCQPARASPIITPNDQILVVFNPNDSSQSAIRAYRASDGQVLWTTQINNLLHSTPAFHNNTIYLLSYARVYALNTSGNILWSCNYTGLQEAWRNTIAIDQNGYLYFGTRTSPAVLFSLDPSQNTCASRLRWKVTLGPSTPVYGPPALDESRGYLYFSTEQGLLRVQMSDGSGAGSIWYATDRPLYAPPILDNQGNLYFGAHRGSLYSVSPTGSLRWELPGVGIQTGGLALSSDGKLYATTDDGFFVVLGEQASAPTPQTRFDILYVIIREAKVPSTNMQERISASQEQDIDRKMQEFADRVRYEYSREVLTITLRKKVLEQTASVFSSPCNGGYWTDGNEFDGDVTPDYNQGEVDLVIYFWGGDPLPGKQAIYTCGIWGRAVLTGEGPRLASLKGAGRISIHYMPGQDHLEVIEHEWEHIVFDDAGILTRLHGIRDPLLPETHNGWTLRQVPAYAWKEVNNIDRLNAPFPSEYLALGCFDQAPQGGFNEGIYYAYIPETTTQPAPGDNQGGKTWATLSASNGIANLYNAFYPDSRDNDCAAYLHVYVKIPQDGYVKLWISSSSDFKVFLDNRPALAAPDRRWFVFGRFGLDPVGVRRDLFQLSTYWTAGWHRILLKTVSVAGYLWRAGFRITAHDGTSIPGLRYCASPPGSPSCSP